MKGKMKTGLVEIYKSKMPFELDEEIRAFLTKIDGQEIDVVFTNGDAFEKNDNNIWLPEWLFEYLPEPPQ